MATENQPENQFGADTWGISPQSESQEQLASAIISAAEKLSLRDKDSVEEREAASVVKADLWIMERITDKDQRFYAATALSEVADQHSTYKAELEKLNPTVAAEVAEAGAENERRSSEKDERKTKEFKLMEEAKVARAAAWTEEQGKLFAAQHLADLRDKEVLDLTDASYLRADMDRYEKASEPYRLELARLQANQASAKVNTLEPSIEKEQQLLSGSDAERRSTWLSKAKPAETEVSASLPGSQNHVDSDEIFTATQPEIRPLVPVDVADKYHQVGDEFYSKPAGTELVFEDKGNRLETRSSGEQVAESLVRIAEARGWDEIKVAGTETFRKEVWLEAAARGMHVKGYVPSEQDKADLEKQTTGVAAANDADRAAFRGRETSATPEATVPESKSQVLAKSYASDSAVEAVRKHPELVGAIAATAAIDKRAQADGLSPEQQALVQARVRQNIINSIEAGNIPKPVEIREEIERPRDVENHREVVR